MNTHARNKLLLILVRLYRFHGNVKGCTRKIFTVGYCQINVLDINAPYFIIIVILIVKNNTLYKCQKNVKPFVSCDIGNSFLKTVINIYEY